MTETRPAADLKKYLEKAVAKRQVIHYLPVYRAEHRLKLLDWLDIKLGMEQPSVPFIRGVVNMRNYKTAEELVEIERACNVTADMHITAMKVLRIGPSAIRETCGIDTFRIHRIQFFRLF